MQNTQTKPRPAVEKRAPSGAGRRVVAIILAVVLGAGAGVGVNFALTGGLPFGGFSAAVQSDIPTDDSGDNIVGNHLENLQNGGLITAQGSQVFYANLADGGCLYTAVDGGKDVYKLTDFAVANLNISGDRLVFTDLADSYLAAEGGPVPVAAASVVEMLRRGEGGLLRFGGNMYILHGVRDFSEGKIGWDEMELLGFNDSGSSFQAPILSDGAILVTVSQGGAEAEGVAAGELDLERALTPAVYNGGSIFVERYAQVDANSAALGKAFSTQDFVVIGKDGKAVQANITGASHPYIGNVLTYGKYAYVELVSANSSKENIIVRYDTESNKVVDSMPGYNMRDVGDRVAFVHPRDELIYDHRPQSDHFGLVSNIKCPNGFNIDSNGNIRFDVKDTATGKDVNVLIGHESSYRQGDKREVHTAQPGVLSAANKPDWYTYVNPPEWMRGKGPGAQHLKDHHYYATDDGWALYQYNRQKDLLPSAKDKKELPGWLDGTPRDLRENAPMMPVWNRTEGYEDYLNGQQEKDNSPTGDTAAQGEQQDEDQTEAEETPDEKADEEAQGASSGDPINGLAQLMDYMKGQRTGGTDWSIYYGDAVSFRARMGDLAGKFEAEFGARDRGEDLLDAMESCMNFSKYTIDSYIETTDSDGREIMLVDVTVSERVDLNRLLDQLQLIFIKEIQEHPGGQAGIVEKGEEYFINWAVDVVIKVMHNPAEYDLIDTTVSTEQIEMVYTDQLGWVVKPNNLSKVIDILVLAD